MSLVAIGLKLAEVTGLAGKLGKWLGGANGEAVAKQVISIAQAVTGETDPQKAADAVLANKAQLMEFEEQLFQRELQLSQLAFQNTENARAMQVEALKQNDNFSKRFIYYLALLWSSFAAFYITLITFLEIPEKSIRFADSALSFLLGTVVATIVCFFYGGSLGRDRSDESNSRKT